jgi:hypothetical protein
MVQVDSKFIRFYLSHESDKNIKVIQVTPVHYLTPFPHLFSYTRGTSQCL